MAHLHVGDPIHHEAVRRVGPVRGVPVKAHVGTARGLEAQAMGGVEGDQWWRGGVELRVRTAAHGHLVRVRVRVKVIARVR